MKGRIGKAKFNSLKIILDSGARYSIIIGKYAQKLRNKITKLVHWSTQEGNFNTNYTSKV